ncbi:MAG: SAM-dependent chlorinase/fluorinase [Myxococcota bacterium]
MRIPCWLALATAVLTFTSEAPAQTPRRNVFLVTDYGNDDFYVGALKGGLLEKNPEASVHDITHNIPAYDIRAGAYILAQATDTLPPESIVVVVVDPGVGTARRSVALKTKRGTTYIGPDNGLFTFVIERQGVADFREITNKDAMRPSAHSSTFHGRDIYGPAAGWLSRGQPLEQLGPTIKDPVQFKVARAERRGTSVHGEVVLADHYGNLLTNIPRELAESMATPDPKEKTRKVVTVKLGGATVSFPLMSTYGNVPVGSPVAVINSVGNLELAINQGNASGNWNVKTGAAVELVPAR